MESNCLTSSIIILLLTIMLITSPIQVNSFHNIIFRSSQKLIFSTQYYPRTTTSFTSHLSSSSSLQQQQQLQDTTTATNSSLYGKRKRKKSYYTGENKDFTTLKEYHVPYNGFPNFEKELSFITYDNNNNSNNETIAGRLEKLKLEADNMTLPYALMLLDSNAYPSLSKARKAIRNGAILIYRNSNNANIMDSSSSSDILRGTSIDRVYPSDKIASQVRTGGSFYPGLTSKMAPNYTLPILYEDDHMALVNKPAGIVVYAHRNDGGDGITTVMSVRSKLPFVLTPPKEGTMSILRRPQPVHRLDKTTSGILIIAKTKPAMVHLSQQFVKRIVQKSYMAIVNGIPDDSSTMTISAQTAREDIGVDVDVDSTATNWQLIDEPLDEKHAITLYRPLKCTRSLKADQNILTLLDIKIKTGRYHQIRRHMANIIKAPIVGDKAYDIFANDNSKALRGKGIFLCCNKVVLDHPFFNTEEGREVFDGVSSSLKKEKDDSFLRLSEDGTVKIHCCIDLPEKFEKFLLHEDSRFAKFNGDTNIE